MRRETPRWQRKRERVKGHAAPRATVVKGRRPPTYPCRWTGPYRLLMAIGSREDTWSAYLQSMTKRPGWSVARLARESGIARQTIFEWIRVGNTSLTIASVRAVAKALDADMVTAMLAAGGVLGPPERDDGEIRHVLDHPRLTTRQKEAIVASIRARRVRSLEETQAMIDLADREP